jgi:predicted adenine nucleotide alpha hydrolase (AANH) superfamily ATPase
MTGPKPKENYQLRLEQEIAQNRKNNRRPRLLLHACCAPCSSYVLEYLCQYFDITLFFYNPNIAPEEEYRFRAEELQRLIAEMPAAATASYAEGPYDPARFYEIAKGLEQLPEGGERCFRCYRLRLDETARYAAANGFDYFTTTLSISPYKNAAKLNTIGAELAEVYGVKYLFSDFKKKGGYLRSCRLSAEYGLYRQDYCGCAFSKAEALRRRSAETN